MKPCNVTEMISSLIDGELSPKDTESVRQHLEDCVICRKEFDALKSVDNLLRDVKPVEPSYDFARGFWKKVDALDARKTKTDARKTKKSLWPIFNDFSWGLRPSLVSAAAVILIAAGTVIFYRSAPPALDPTGMLIAENMALYSDYEIIDNLELFENWEEIIKLDEI